MYRYTTPTLPVEIEDIDFAEVDFFRIAIKMDSEILLFIVDAEDPTVDPETNTIYIALTQEQTAELNEGYAKIQARFKYKNGSVDATNKAKITIEDVIDQVII